MEMREIGVGDASHAAYADESYYVEERFRSVAVVSLENCNRAAFSRIFRTLLNDSGIGEFKWSKLRQVRERFAATKMINSAIQLAKARQLRVDVLIWDTHDSRHQVQRRDDIANFQRMYYHLFKNVLLRRWPLESAWNLMPDENSALDWGSMRDYLDTAGMSIELASPLFDGKPFSIRLSQDFRIVQITEVSSTAEPICQVADLFAGIGAYSHAAFSRYRDWLNSENGQLQFATEALEMAPLTNSERQRFIVMKYLDDKCKTYEFRVSLRTARGFRTYDPSFPINFWPYEPQNARDKAPTK